MLNEPIRYKEADCAFNNITLNESSGIDNIPN